MKALQLNNVTISLPGKWNELSCKQYLSVCEILETYSNINELRLLLLLKISGIRVLRNKIKYIDNERCFKIIYNRSVYGWISVVDLAFVASAFDFIFNVTKNKEGVQQYGIDCKLTTNLLPHIVVKKANIFKLQKSTILYGPDDGLTNLVFSEYISAETNLSRWHNTKDDTYLYKFLAVLYRPGKKESEWKLPTFDGDMRLPFNEASIDKHAKLTAQLSAVERKAILLWYSGCKQFMFERFPHVFSRENSTGKTQDPFKSFMDLVAILADNKPADKPIIRKQLLFDILDSLEKMRIEAIEREQNQPKK